MRSLLAAAAMLLVALLVAACGSVESLSFRPPPPTPPSSTTTTPADATGVPLNGVGGTTMAAVPVGPGFATLSGIALGSQGPVGGATVHVERLVGDAVGSVSVTAKPDGTWTVPGILGGRYRVRAWRPPDMAMTTPQIFFLGATENKSLTLQLPQFGIAGVTATIAPDPPLVGGAANLLVQVTGQVVSTSGIVSSGAVASASVQLTAGVAVTINSPNPTTTRASGLALFQITCQLPGPASLTVTINGGGSHALAVSDCTVPAPPPPPTAPTTATTPTTVAPSTSSSTPTTTTTVPSTTSTT